MPQLQKKRALGKNEVEPLYLFVCVSFFFFFSFLLKKSVCLMLALLLAKAGHKKEDTYSSFPGTYVGLVGTNST